MKEQVEARTLREGRYILVDDEPCKILDISTSKPGKHGAAKMNITAASIFTGSKQTIVTSVNEKVFVPLIDKRRAQVIAVHAGNAQLMDSETYQTFDMPVPEEFKDMQAGQEVEYFEAMGRKMITRAS